MKQVPIAALLFLTTGMCAADEPMAETAAHQQRSRVASDHCEDREQRPRETVWLRAVQEQVVVERHSDVERARRAHRPPTKALTAAGNEQERRQAPDERERQDRVDVDVLEQRAAVREEDAQRKQQPGWSA